ncbi:MAG: hypothetical protein JNM56_33285, partial [Planctomycetia bacterium]|nr:hypothetical protein [Planctomycetia bacterium]
MNDPKQLSQKFLPKEIKQLKTDRQMCIVRFSPDGKQLVAGGQDARIRRWDEQFNELPALEGHGGWVQVLAFA